MKPKPPVETKAGAKVVVTCRCGTKLRFTMPGKPLSAAAQQFSDQMHAILDGAYGKK